MQQPGGGVDRVRRYPQRGPQTGAYPRGSGSSNPFPSSGESVNFRFLPLGIDHEPAGRAATPADVMVWPTTLSLCRSSQADSFQPIRNSR